MIRWPTKQASICVLMVLSFAAVIISVARMRRNINAVG